MLDAKTRAKKTELIELRHALKFLKRDREMRGLRVADVAGRSGIDKSRLSKLENDAFRDPTPATLTRIATTVDVKLTSAPSR